MKYAIDSNSKGCQHSDKYCVCGGHSAHDSTKSVTHNSTRIKMKRRQTRKALMKLLTFIFIITNLAALGQCDSLQKVIDRNNVILEIQEKEMISYEWKLDAATKKIEQLQKDISFYQTFLQPKKKRKA